MGEVSKIVFRFSDVTKQICSYFMSLLLLIAFQLYLSIFPYFNFLPYDFVFHWKVFIFHSDLLVNFYFRFMIILKF